MAEKRKGEQVKKEKKIRERTTKGKTWKAGRENEKIGNSEIEEGINKQ